MIVDVSAEVLENVRLSPEFNVLSLAAPAVARLTRPGQFVMVRVRPGLDPLLRRPFSVFEILRDDAGQPRGISLLNKIAGVGTGWLYRAEPGTRVDVLGPLGQPFAPVDPPAEAWMVAGGVGLAPFATLAEALALRGTSMTLFYGARTAEALYRTDLFERLGARLSLSTDDGSRGAHGRITGPLEQALDALDGRPVTIYACGPTPMMRAVSALAAHRDAPVFVSLEPVMGCGMGGCYSCVVRVQAGERGRFVRSCLEGPVFDASTLVWEALPAGH
ncbi:MAG TPA: dihydroorotate dehydrogenase electron transfer subunit [Vicinamibacterales bacterium]|nr:dihydroorotate dehydrogenase electron transfer subunit [Vicinamibacterales bacterium]